MGKFNHHELLKLLKQIVHELRSGVPNLKECTNNTALSTMLESIIHYIPPLKRIVEDNISATPIGRSLFRDLSMIPSITYNAKNRVNFGRTKYIYTTTCIFVIILSSVLKLSLQMLFLCFTNKDNSTFFSNLLAGIITTFIDNLETNRQDRKGKIDYSFNEFKRHVRNLDSRIFYSIAQNSALSAILKFFPKSIISNFLTNYYITATIRIAVLFCITMCLDVFSKNGPNIYNLYNGVMNDFNSNSTNTQDYLKNFTPESRHLNSEFGNNVLIMFSCVFFTKLISELVSNIALSTASRWINNHAVKKIDNYTKSLNNPLVSMTSVFAIAFSLSLNLPMNALVFAYTASVFCNVAKNTLEKNKLSSSGRFPKRAVQTQRDHYIKSAIQARSQESIIRKR